MSDDLHPTRLRWCAAWGRGWARYDGIGGPLYTRPPVLMHVERLIDLDFSPGTGTAIVQDATSAQRSLERWESEECLAYVRRAADAWKRQTESAA